MDADSRAVPDPSALLSSNERSGAPQLLPAARLTSIRSIADKRPDLLGSKPKGTAAIGGAQSHSIGFLPEESLEHSSTASLVGGVLEEGSVDDVERMVSLADGMRREEQSPASTSGRSHQEPHSNVGGAAAAAAAAGYGDRGFAFLISLPTYVKELIAGGAAGAIAKTCVAPLERIKILYQTHSVGFQSAGVVHSLGTIVRTEGTLGLYRGNGAAVVRIIPYAALHFMAYEHYRRVLVDLHHPTADITPVVDLLAGSVAGATAVLLTYPLDLIRTRLAFQVAAGEGASSLGSPLAAHGIRGVFSSIVKQSGVRGLYSGIGPTLLGILPYAGLKFYVYEALKSHLPPDSPPSIATKLSFGAIAGLLGQTATYPLDVVRRQMQVQGSPVAPQGAGVCTKEHFKGTLHGLRCIVQQQGWRQLYSGLSLNYLKIVPSVAIGFTVYDSVKAWLQVPPREKRRSTSIS